VKVPHSEGVANHTDPESCVRHREVSGEALTGECIGQPLSRESRFIRDADAVFRAEGNMGRRVIARSCLIPRGRRPWHVQTLLVREPGDLTRDRTQVGVPVRIGKARSRSR
jgi:hypothetical protein